MGAEAVLIDIIGRDKASMAFDKVAASAERSARKVDGVAASMTRAGSKMTRSLTVPVLAVGAASLKIATDQQKALTLLTTAGGESQRQMKAIGNGIKKTAVDTGTSLGKLNDGMYIVAKADHKWAAVDQLKVLKAAAQGAKAENVDLGTATTALTSVMQSYGLGASKAVATENQLIKGAGLAKTTYQEYAASLANVVPLASSLHISFAQVSGAIDTMTQHGDSAQRATDDLNNLIRNLAGQNNVASSAMQQLGIDTVDLSKNLGKRGLTGTLAIVSAALKAHTKDGMIVTDVHKAAALATKSLDQELGVMTPNLRTQSRELLNGSTNIKDYTKFAKSMGGDAGAQALQFLALYKSSKGFNDQLRSGNGTIKTSAAEMLKLLGGSTAMNTALMLGVGAGKEGAASQKLFGQSVAEVAKTAKLSGADVLGWADTQDTMAVKAGKTKAELQVLGLEIGDALIPRVSKMVGWVSKAVHWFEGLSGTQKKILGWSVVVLAALGPVLAVGGRLATVGRGIGTFVGGVSTRLATLAGSSEAQAGRVSTAMRGMTSALAGVGVGYAFGSLTKNSSNATKAIGALGATATGAAIGFGVGGPWGAAIGGAAGLVTSLATSFMHSGNAAKDAQAKHQAAAQAMIAQKQMVDNLTTAIETDNDALRTNTRLQVASDLQKSGAFTIARKYGLSLKTLTSAVMGNAGASKSITDSLMGVIGAGDIGGAGKLMNLLAGEGVNMRTAALAADQMAEAQGKLNLKTRSVAQEFGRYGKSLDSTNQAGAMNIKFIRAHVQALDAEYQGGKLTEGQYKQKLSTLQKQLVAYTRNKDGVTGLIATLTKLPRSVLTKILADPKVANSAVGQALSRLKTLPQKKNTDVTATDKATPTINGVMGNLGLLPGDKGIGVTVADHASDALINIKRHLDSINGKTVVINEVTNGHVQGSGKVLKAAGGAVYGPGGPTSDSVDARLSNGEHVLTASDVRKAGGQGAVYRMRGLIQRGALRFARGGAVAFAKGGKVDTAAIGTAIGNIGQAYSPKFSVADVGIGRIDAQIAHATAVLNEQIRKGLSASAAATFRHEIASMRAEATRQLASLKVKIKGADTSALTTALKGSVDGARQAFAQMITDAQRAGASSAEIAAMRRTESAITAKMRQRDNIGAKLGSAPTAPTAYDKLATAQSDYDNAKQGASSAIMGTFDISSAGRTGGSILSRLTSLVAKSKTFGGVLKKLGAMKLAPALLQQLAQAGPAALPQAQALLSSGAGTIGQINSQFKELQGASSDVGKYVADQSYGAGVSAAKGYIKALQDQQSALNKAITHMADGMVSTLEKKLGIHATTAAPKAHAAQKAHESSARKSSTSHGHTPSHGKTSAKEHAEAALHAGKGHGVNIENLHIHDQRDPVAAAHAVTRRLAHLGAA